MEERLVSEFIVPAREGHAFILHKGQVMSIIEVEGKQMADVAFLNANDRKEVFHAGWSAALNMIAGEGNLRRLKKLYSKPPRDNVMLTVVDDPVGVHLAWNGGRCSRKTYEQFFNLPGHRSCQDNLAEALAPFGVMEDDVPDVFNVFMNVVGFEEGRFEMLEPVAEKDDYISLRAEMDILVAISACPFDLLYIPKPLQVKITAP
jgi:uncharacterized protein